MNELKKGCTLQQGKYRIVRTLGRGSFGITYLATTKVSLSGSLGQMDVTVNVAIKEFFMEEFNRRSSDGSCVDDTNSSLVKNYRKKFYREADNLSKLRHPNIVRVLEVFDENNTSYYAMEYINGETLDEYIKSKGRIPENEAIVQLREIGSALKHMHDNKMLHLDLKPKNIMRNVEGHLLLIDFGLSKQYDQNGEPESSTTLGLGTPGYAPIEQAYFKQEGAFPATLDIYAIGATFYKMLTGMTPPYASTVLDEGLDISTFEKCRLSENTIKIVQKAMSPRRKERYQDVYNLLAALGGNTEDGNTEVDVINCIPNIPTSNELPIPYGISLGLENPNGVSYAFYLSSKHCNTVKVSIDGETFINDEFIGGISNELISSLRKNGLLDLEHWEKREQNGEKDGGIRVYCNLDFNSTTYMRVDNNADLIGRTGLLRAIENVVAETEVLSKFIYEAFKKQDDSVSKKVKTHQSVIEEPHLQRMENFSKEGNGVVVPFQENTKYFIFTHTHVSTKSVKDSITMTYKVSQNNIEISYLRKDNFPHDQKQKIQLSKTGFKEILELLRNYDYLRLPSDNVLEQVDYDEIKLVTYNTPQPTKDGVTIRYSVKMKSEAFMNGRNANSWKSIDRIIQKKIPMLKDWINTCNKKIEKQLTMGYYFGGMDRDYILKNLNIRKIIIFVRDCGEECKFEATANKCEFEYKRYDKQQNSIIPEFNDYRFGFVIDSLLSSKIKKRYTNSTLNNYILYDNVASLAVIALFSKENASDFNDAVQVLWCKTSIYSREGNSELATFPSAYNNIYGWKDLYEYSKKQLKNK